MKIRGWGMLGEKEDDSSEHLYLQLRIKFIPYTFKDRTYSYDLEFAFMSTYLPYTFKLAESAANPNITHYYMELMWGYKGAVEGWRWYVESPDGFRKTFRIPTGEANIKFTQSAFCLTKVTETSPPMPAFLFNLINPPPTEPVV